MRSGIHARPATGRRRRTSRLRHTGECQKSGRAVKKRRNPRTSLRITTDPSEITRRDSSRRYHRPATNKIETFVAMVRTPLSGPPSTSRLTLDPWSCSFSKKKKINEKERDQSAGKRPRCCLVKRNVQTAREIINIHRIYST